MLKLSNLADKYGAIVILHKSLLVAVLGIVMLAIVAFIVVQPSNLQVSPSKQPARSPSRKHKCVTFSDSVKNSGHGA